MVKAKDFWDYLCMDLGYRFFSGVVCPDQCSCLCSHQSALPERVCSGRNGAGLDLPRYCVHRTSRDADSDPPVCAGRTGNSALAPPPGDWLCCCFSHGIDDRIDSD